MKQVIQNYKTGEIKVAEIPVPSIKSGGVLVRNIASLISAGTEKLMLDIDKNPEGEYLTRFGLLGYKD